MHHRNTVNSVKQRMHGNNIISGVTQADKRKIRIAIPLIAGSQHYHTSVFAQFIIH
jgi:hypothetical protein